jgi:hypothetical protein
MQPLFISDFFSENIVKAICWTIIHSMWQGMILAVLTGFVMLCTKKYSPDTRYNLFVLLFAAFIFTAGFTFTYELRIVNQANTVPVLIPAPGPLPPGETIPEILHVGQPESKSFFADWFRNYCGLLYAASDLCVLLQVSVTYSGSGIIRCMIRENTGKIRYMNLPAG